MILHLIQKDKFTHGFIAFINDHFDPSEHRFFVYGEDSVSGYRESSDSNVRNFPGSQAMLLDRDVRASFGQAELIVANGCFNWPMLFSLYRHRSRLCLLFWGGDIYSLSTKSTPVKNIVKRLALSFVENCGYVSTLFMSDYRELSSFACLKGSYYPLTLLPDQSQVPDYRSLRDIEKCTHPIRILLGNSATPTNRHKSVIEQLAAYKQEDMVVYAPLSYGDPSYRDEVIAYGSRLLKEKFIPIVDFMPYTEYLDFLNSCSVGVFNHHRQQGMGNLYCLGQLGAKVYLASDSIMLEELAHDGIAVYDTDSIGDISYSEFLALSNDVRQSNINAIEKKRSLERAISLWSALFEEARRRTEAC